MTSPQLKGVLFDAYGTLFDVYSVGALAEELFPGNGAALAEIWRVAQIDYTRIRTLSNRYRDFWAITGDALDFAAAKLGLDLTNEKHSRLMDQYYHLQAFPEVPEVIAKLKAANLPLAILSNGTPEMLSGAIDAAALEGSFDHVLSAHSVRQFKTADAAYQLGLDALGAQPEELLFVSSNGWDVCGASWFGYRTFWVNRAGAPLDRLDVTPDGEGRDLGDLLPFAGTG